MKNDEKIIRAFYVDGPAKTFSKCPLEKMTPDERRKSMKPEKRHIEVMIDGKKDPRNRSFRDFEDVRECFAHLQERGYYRGYEIIFPNNVDNHYE